MSDAPLNAEQILAAAGRPEYSTRDVPVPELGGHVRVREMSEALRNELEMLFADPGDKAAERLSRLTAQILAWCVLDENDRPILTPQTARRLAAARPKASIRLRQAIVEVTGVDDAETEEMAEVFGEGP